jgi:hypothetical protein
MTSNGRRAATALACGLAWGCSGDGARTIDASSEGRARASESSRDAADADEAPADSAAPDGQPALVPPEGGPSPAAGASGEGAGAPSTGLDLVDEALASDPPPESEWVFDPSALRTYELNLTPEDWQTLQDTAEDEQYVPADLVVDGRATANVGLRFKGSLGTLVSCFDDSGARICDKLSMKIEFSEYVPEQRFVGLRRLVFNSMLSDYSQLRERLAYRVYREMGLVAPRAAHARLVVNGEGCW